MSIRIRTIVLSAILLTALTAVPGAWAQLEVPVVYTFTEGSKAIEGVLTGGSLCEEEGLSLKDATATRTRIVAFNTIDRLENISMIGGAKLLLYVVLKDGNRFQAYADVPQTDPLFIFRDELPEGASGTPKLRTFTKANFKGIHEISFEAEPEVEMSDEDAEKLAAELVQAIKEEDLEKAIDIHNQLGDFLESWQNSEDDEDDPATGTEKAN